MNKYILNLIVLLLIFGCYPLQNEPLFHYPVPEQKITVNNYVIYHDDSPIIKVRFEGELSGKKTQYRKLFVYYYSEDREVEVFPSLGGSRGEYLAWCFDVKISNDGKFVFYTVPTFLSDTVYKYSIEKGTVKKAGSHWNQRLL